MSRAYERKPILVEIPDDLREKAGGVSVVTCRTYGGGQIERVVTARATRLMERTERTGQVMLTSIKEHEARLNRERDEQGDRPDDPIEDALAEHPPDLVCARVVRRLDDDAVRGDAAHRMGRGNASGRVAACRDQGFDQVEYRQGISGGAGGRFGRFVRCLTDAAPIPDGDARILFAHRHFGGSIQDAADLTYEPITLATYGRLVEYDALLAVHIAWLVEDKGQAKADAARDYPGMYESVCVDGVGWSMNDKDLTLWLRLRDEASASLRSLLPSLKQIGIGGRLGPPRLVSRCRLRRLLIFRQP